MSSGQSRGYRVAGHDSQLLLAALAGIAVIVLLITWLKVHPFLALILGSAVLGVAAGMPLDKFVTSFSAGLGSTTASVGSLIVLGAMLGRLLADSGGIDQIVEVILGRSAGRALPWLMAMVAVLVGLPMFFEIGLVLLIPVVLLVARRGNQSLVRIGIPALAGLSVLHGLVPPHPGPLAAVGVLKANLGLTLGFGLLVAIPTVVVAGPLFSSVAARWVDVAPPENLIASGGSEERGSDGRRRPSFAATLFTVLLPIALMLLKAL
ncbi:MAG: gluconate transporter, partial [Kutzneria sp.]|nr:gluconate transporter [Kutzneria sp.]